MTNKIVFDIEGNTDPFKKSVDKVEGYIDDTRRRLKDEKGLELTTNLGKLKLQMDSVNALIKKAIKDGDVDRVVALKIDKVRLQKEATIANRALNNYINTGNQNYSALARLFDKVGVDIGKLGIDVNTGVGKALDNALGKMVSFGSKASTIFGGLAIGGALATIGTAAIGLGDKLEQAQISFEVMLGSADKAKALLSDLKDFAKKTPFELTGIRDTAKQLIAFGIDSNKLIPTMKALGDVAAGTGAPLERIAFAYGQINTARRASAQDLNQLTSAGVPIYKELAKVMGVAESNVKKMVEDGKVGFPQVEQAFKNMTSAGGQFQDLMEKQSKSLSGQVSNLKDSLASVGEQLGTALLPIAKGFVQILQSLVNLMTSQAFLDFLKFAGTIAGLVTGFYALTGAVALMTTVGTAGFTALGASIYAALLPFAPLIAAIALATAGFVAYQKNLVGFTEVVDDIMTSFQTLFDFISQVFVDLSSLLGGFFSDVADKTDQSTSAQASMWEYLGAFIAVLWANLIGFIQGLIDTLTQVFSSAINFFTDENESVTDKLKAGWKSFGDAWLNTIISAANAGIAYIEKWANKALGLINSVIDKMSFGTIKTQFGISLGRFASVGDGKGIFEKSASSFMSGLETLANNVNKRVEEKTQSMIDSRAKKLDAKIARPTTGGGFNGAIGGGTFTPTAKSGGKSGKNSDAVKKKEEELRAIAKKEVDAVNASQLSEKRKAEVIKGIKEKLESDIKEIQGKSLENEFEAADKKLKAVEDAEKKKKDVVKNVSDDINSQWEESVKKVANYTEAIEKLKQQIQKLRDDAVKNIREINNELDAVDKEKVKAQEDAYKGLATRRVDLLKQESDIQRDLISITDVDELAKKQQELSDIRSEIALIEATVSQDVLSQVAAYEALNQTQKDLIALKEKQIELDQKRAQLSEQKAINQAIADGKKLKIEQDGANLKAFYTDDKGQFVEIMDFKNKEYALSQQQQLDQYDTQLAAQQKMLDAELLNLQNLDASRRAIESSFTEYFKGEIDKRNAKLKEYISMLEAAARAAQSSGLEQQAQTISATGSSASSTVKNTTVNNNIYNPTDATSVTRYLNKNT